MGMYFDRDTDVWIVKYHESLKSAQEAKRAGDQAAEKIAMDGCSTIFHDNIMPAFVKLIDSQLQIYRWYKIDDRDMLRCECLSHLYEVLPKFDPTKGKKGFSYFNVVVKNFFTNKARDQQKRLKQQSENFFGIDHDIVKNDPSVVLSSYENEILEKEFWLSLVDDMKKWRELVKKQQELQVLDAIIFLIQNPTVVSVYNKKAVHFYIKEITGLNAKQVNHNVNKLKELYLLFREDFQTSETR